MQKRAKDNFLNGSFHHNLPCISVTTSLSDKEIFFKLGCHPIQQTPTHHSLSVSLLFLTSPVLVLTLLCMYLQWESLLTNIFLAEISRWPLSVWLGHFTQILSDPKGCSKIPCCSFSQGRR